MNETEYAAWVNEQLDWRNANFHQVVLRMLWSAGGELTALELFTKLMAAGVSDKDPRDMCRDTGFEPTDIIRLTAAGMDKVGTATGWMQPSSST